MKLGLVIMAAGAGTRFGGGKLLAAFQGIPLYSRVLDSVPQDVFQKVAVVTAIAPMLEAARARGFVPVVNDRPELGVSRTIRLGLEAMGRCDGVMFLAADQPLLRAQTVQQLAKEFEAHPDCIVAPAARGKRGGPCTFPAEFYPALLALTGDRGGAGILKLHPDRLRLMEVAEAELWDADTPEALAALERRNPSQRMADINQTGAPLDISFPIPGGKFNYRVCAMIIDGDKILAMHDERSPYYYLPGGRVRMGETAEQAVLREVEEELGISPKISRPLWLNQSFFQEDVDGLQYHELCIYFLMDIAGTDLLRRGSKFSLQEGRHRHDFEWLAFDRLKDAYFYPLFLKTEIFHLPSTLTIRTERE